MKKLKKLAALFLAAAMVCVSATAYADEVVEITEEPQTLEVYCPGANEDPEFPFSFDIDVDPSTISYIDLDEPLYGFEQLLDEEALDFDVRFALKDEYKNFDSFEFQVLDADYTEEIAAGTFQNDEVFTIPGLSIGTGYKISIALISETLTAYYGGQFTIQAELDSTLAVDLFYQLGYMEGEAAVYNNICRESRSGGNSLATAQTLAYDQLTVGSVVKGQDDYYNLNSGSYADPDEEGQTGIVNLLFNISLAPKSIVKLEFFDENNKSVKTFEPTVATYQLFCRFANVPISTTRKVRIYTDSECSIDYYLTPSREFKPAWFGQYVSKDTDGVYWNTNKLEDVYSGKYRIFKEGLTGIEDHVFTTGCGISAAAMIFRNLGATMDGYDLRTNTDGELQADPYTALLANIDDDGRNWASATSFPGGNAPELFDEKIGKKFGFKENMKRYDIDESELREAIANYGYVLAYFNENDKYRRHFMVLTGLESGSGTIAEKAIVFDPAGMSYAEGAGANGNGIKLTDTAWYKRNKNYFIFSSARVFVK